MDQTVAEGNVSGGSKPVRPDRLKQALIMDSDAFLRSQTHVAWCYSPDGPGTGTQIPGAWGDFPGPAPPLGTGTQIPGAWGNFPGGPALMTCMGTQIPVPWGNFPGGLAPPTVTGTQSNFSGGPTPPTGTSIIDGEPWPKFSCKITPGMPGPSRIIDGNTGKPVQIDPADIESDEKFFESIRRRAQEMGFDFPIPSEIPSEIPSKIPEGIFYVTERDRNLIVFSLREDLKYSEHMFKRLYCYGITAYGSSDPFTGSMEVRHCLTVHSDDAFCWMEKSSGIKWVGVYGINAICVVTLGGHVDWKRLNGGSATTDPKPILSLFRKCVLSELEDLADPSSGLARRRFDVPFCVACETPGTIETPNESGVEISSVGYAAEAVDFVRSSGLLPKVEDSGAVIQLAISAFERLIQKKCEATEIEVTVVSGRRHGIPTIKDLDISEIGDNLAIINHASEKVV